MGSERPLSPHSFSQRDRSPRIFTMQRMNLRLTLRKLKITTGNLDMILMETQKSEWSLARAFKQQSWTVEQYSQLCRRGSERRQQQVTFARKSGSEYFHRARLKFLKP